VRVIQRRLEPVVGVALKRELTLFEWHRVAPVSEEGF